MAVTDSQDNGKIIHGENEAEIELAGTSELGDAIGWSSGWKRGLATVGTAIQLRCVAGENGSTGQKIKAYFGLTVVGGTRFSGATVGGELYVAEGTSNGMYTQTAPTDTGDCDTIVGYMVSATEAVIIPNRNTDSIA